MSFGGRLGFKMKGQSLSVCLGLNFSVTIFEVQSLSAAVKRELCGGVPGYSHSSNSIAKLLTQ